MSFNYTVHTIRPGDTLQKIASLYRCDWQTIATTNNLEPPYLVPQDYQREGWAQGIVHLKRIRFITSPITVPKGTVLVSMAVDYPLYYYTQEEVTILPEDEVVPVLVRAEAPGATYNLPSESVLQFQDTTLNEYLVVRVPEGFTGGFVKRVKKYGETIY
ncbi:LysM peptidoglycan-binding domain-containing protein, partial [Candidatus Caldatribacterium sp.]|uniref:LysM peptidoglycan-binding domain-containing protein n=1 Tax=Candidatus Caldatribacterium sp. TaxID=2282143 RepID=UPI00384841DE|nr:LysM peptidoglycan-binding domain-containing protein [Candidatus Caldatribacterium sp.]